eukprot:350946-Chlamydomonas_euryale.AAC.3
MAKAKAAVVFALRSSIIPLLPFPPPPACPPCPPLPPPAKNACPCARSNVGYAPRCRHAVLTSQYTKLSDDYAAAQEQMASVSETAARLYGDNESTSGTIKQLRQVNWSHYRLHS